MPPTSPNCSPTIICHCTQTSQELLEQLISSHQVNTLEEIAVMTGATTGCGGCEYAIEELLLSFPTR